MKNFNFYNNPKYIEIIEAIESSNFRNKSKLTSDGSARVDPYENIVITRLNTMVSEMHRVFDKEKQEKCLDNVYEYYVKKLKRYKVNKNTYKNKKVVEEGVDTLEGAEADDTVLNEFFKVNNFMPKSMNNTGNDFYKSKTKFDDDSVANDDLGLREDLATSIQFEKPLTLDD